MTERETILLVDDEELNRDALSRRLERSGFNVEVANGGVEALLKISERPFDLILLDQMMPGKSGTDVLRELRTHYSQSRLPVIMVTAVTESSRVAESLDLGANDYITKPVDFAVALARIRAQLSRRRAETARRVSDERYDLVARAANDGLWDWDLISQQVYYSTRWKSMAGLTDAEVGTSPNEWFSRVHPDDVVALREAIQYHLESRSEGFEFDYRIRRKDGLYSWMTGRGMALRNPEGVPVRMAGSQSDATRKKTIDELTGLPNRYLLHERLRIAIERARRDPASQFALYFVDVDRFKVVNDTFGHVAGDKFLVDFADRLRCITTGTNSLIARLGGDEFALLLESPDDTAGATALGAQLIRIMLPPFLVGEREFFVSASVGIVMSRTEHSTVEDLIRDADIAMYAAKAKGRGCWVLFDDSMRQTVLDRFQIETDLRTALAKGQFVVYYQPRVDLDTGQVRGFEALLRWEHPQRGIVMPNEFIQIAEETGMIREIGLWVLGEACRQMSVWRKQFPDQPWLDVAVNVSPVQLCDPDLVGQIAQILSATGIETAALQIEITESALLENLDETREVLLNLKGLGIGLKLDDFGTGYSCLRYLNQLPFDTIKIDRTFVSTLDDHNAESKELLGTIVSMAKNLGLGVIAEGIENRGAADVLRGLGCELGQGFYFSQAVNPAAAAAMLQERSGLSESDRPLAGAPEEPTSMASLQ